MDLVSGSVGNVMLDSRGASRDLRKDIVIFTKEAKQGSPLFWFQVGVDLGPRVFSLRLTIWCYRKPLIFVLGITGAGENFLFNRSFFYLRGDFIQHFSKVDLGTSKVSLKKIA